MGRAGRGSTTARELEAALQLETPLLGINNRNLRTFDVTLETTLGLLDRIPADRIVVSESGILAPEDVALMRASGVHAFLVGGLSCGRRRPAMELARLFRLRIARRYVCRLIDGVGIA